MKDLSATVCVTEKQIKAIISAEQIIIISYIMNVKQKEGESNAAFFARNVAMAAFSACVAEAATIPMDTAKVRLQLQKVAPGEKPRYSGLLGTAKTVAAEEGALALWGGLAPGLQR